MLIQLSDELLPVFALRGNTVVLDIDENLTIYADPEKLARVFSNIFRNAAAYSFPQTAIIVSAQETDEQLTLAFQNEGNTIPAEKLSSLFDKFNRSPEALIIPLPLQYNCQKRLFLPLYQSNILIPAVR